jgi:hypothetical protein
MTKQPRRQAARETVFRDVNEAIDRGNWPGDEDKPSAYRCECGRLDCSELLPMTPEAYERIRSDPCRFLVLPGHENPQIETVVERRPSYVVVEKRGEAGTIAEATDPRS